MHAALSLRVLLHGVWGILDSAQTLTYQDAIGDSLLALAQVTPAGMLVFFPSYRMLDKVHCGHGRGMCRCASSLLVFAMPDVGALASHGRVDCLGPLEANLL